MSKILSSAHVHTTFCDGRSTAEEMASTAYELGFVSLGFSSHAPQTFDFEYCIHPSREEEYKTEIRRIQQEYAGRMAVYLGIERDLYSCADPSGYDYFIASVHYLEQPDGSFCSVDGPAEKLQRYVDEYCGGDGLKMRQYNLKGKNLAGGYVGEVIAEALSMAESNACMRRIVAAPTAGSCGVLPAVLIPTAKRFALTDAQVEEALYVAAGIGQVIASRAFIAGATGGCQAEIGSASAMAAGALAYIQGGDEETICHAVAIALKALLGLVCDPVAGLVEVPCVKRNVIGAVNAMTAADQALAGIQSFIPVDQVIDAMREVGEKMDASLRETGLGGLAATPKGMEVTL